MKFFRNLFGNLRDNENTRDANPVGCVDLSSNLTNTSDVRFGSN